MGTLYWNRYQGVSVNFYGYRLILNHAFLEGIILDIPAYHLIILGFVEAF